ncbi:MAG: XRE family transcriptional regulator [Gammaproteobacteria bacterium]|nr:XRE family transcriptional regulator [Gammaproteobacteria bacterium]
MKTMKFTRKANNVFRDLGFPEPEARNLALRSDLLTVIEQYVASSGLTQTVAAKKLGITQSRLSQLLGGHLDRFSLDALVEIATNAGLEIRLSVHRHSILKKPTAKRRATAAA